MEPENQSRQSAWGYGIAAVYTIFAVATLSFVAFTMTQKVELVAPDYYAQEVGYEQQLNRLRQTKELAAQLTCDLSAEGKFIRLQLPANMASVRGKITLYRPSDSTLDQHLEFNPDAQGSQKISTAQLARGVWRVKVMWSYAGREYYNEFTQQV